MILLINGSPNSDIGNCSAIIKKVEELLKEKNEGYEIINVIEVLKSMKMPFCTACSTPCLGVCAKGTLMEKCFESIRKSSGLILFSPVYFGTVSAEIKAFWDLLRTLRREKALYNQVGAAVSVGASKFGGQELTMRTLQDMMFVQGMIVVGDGFGENMGHFGAPFIKPAENDKEGNESLNRLVNRVIEIARKMGNNKE